MNTGRTNSPEQRELFDNLVFLGEITASVTHELNNVLGTIEQVSGLAEDLACTEPARGVGLADRLTDIADRIARQSERGSALLKRLNELAHLTDEPVTEFDLAELLENILALCERFARLRKVPLAVSGLDQKVPLTTSPLLVTQAIYGIYRGVLAGAIPGEPLAVRLENDNAQATIVFEARRDDTAFDGYPAVRRAEALAAGLGGRLEIVTEGDRSAVRLQFPTGGPDGRGGNGSASTETK